MGSMNALTTSSNSKIHLFFGGDGAKCTHKHSIVFGGKECNVEELDPGFVKLSVFMTSMLLYEVLTDILSSCMDWLSRLTLNP